MLLACFKKLYTNSIECLRADGTIFVADIKASKVDPDGNAVLKWLFRNDPTAASFACMFFDLTVPGGMGGLELASELRKMGINLPVFVTSGYAEDPVMASPEKFGFNGSV